LTKKTDEQQTEEPQTTALAPAMTPMGMIEQAIQGKADVAILERLMSLQERWEANEAKKDFDQAMAAAKANIPPIPKDTPGNFGKFASLDSITKAVTPALAAEGLHHRFTSDFDGRNIIISCIISHKRGHREVNRLPSGPDASGGKNAIQAIGSACTYLERYTLLLALGLAPAKEDDGQAAGKPLSPPMSDAQYESLLSYMTSADVTPQNVLARFKVEALTDLTEAQYLEAVATCKARIKWLKENRPIIEETAEEVPDAPAVP
jgi:ERF superfamily